MEQMTPMQLIEAIRAGLSYNPNSPYIKIKYDHNAGYMEKEEVYAAVNALEKKIAVVMSGLDEFTGLEKLALWVLVDSANIK